LVRFPVDPQLPPRLARALTEAGHQAQHVEDIGLRHGKASEIWEYAIRHHAVIVTKDEDFVDRFRRRPAGPVIIWLRIGNVANAL
jgi:predicted nuclease of predicted toxin-antitoxin system